MPKATSEPEGKAGLRSSPRAMLWSPESALHPKPAFIIRASFYWKCSLFSWTLYGIDFAASEHAGRGSPNIWTALGYHRSIIIYKWLQHFLNLPRTLAGLTVTTAINQTDLWLQTLPASPRFRQFNWDTHYSWFVSACTDSSHHLLSFLSFPLVIG